MNDQAPAVRSSPFPLVIAAIILALAAAGYLVFGRQPPATDGNSFVDPSQIPELEIRGQRPDGTTAWSGTPVPAKPELDSKLAAHGKVLFAKACAACHGPEGKGDGPAPKRLDFPSPPADLTEPQKWVKLRTTPMESSPTDEDLFRTITRGLPGTAMWSFRALPESDRWALIAHVKTFSPEYAKPSEVVVIPPKLPRTDDLVAQGKQLYLSVCMNCHGTEGLGPVVPMRDGRTGKVYTGIAWARSGGTEMMSGSSDDDLARTLLTGLDSRSPMRSFKIFFYGSPQPSKSEQVEGDRKLWGTVYYVRDLLERAAK